ncbi:MAG: glycine betaine ABC transporter substrate-binding protein [Spirochaetaceae bacterium]
MEYRHFRICIPKLIIIPALFLFLLLVFSCGKSESTADGELETRRAKRAETTLTLFYPDWSSERASAHLFQAVLQERLGYRVDLQLVPAEEMWRGVAEGEADFITGAWLPTTHRDYIDEYGDSIEDLGPNLDEARIGLAVPASTPGRQTGDTGQTGRDLVTIRSIEELAQTAHRFDRRIVGIESGAGVVARTHDALKAYGMQNRYKVLETDEQRMLNRVSAAINRKEWIVFTGWRPHWVFEHHNLRFLEDPKEVYGGIESIHTMVRGGFEEEAPDAYKVLSRISYTLEDLERLMRWIHEDKEEDPYRQALRWIETHKELVDTWVEGIE